MHDAHLGCALFFLDMLAEDTLLSMTVMVTPCLWYVVGMNLVCPMSKFPQAPFARAPFGESRCGSPKIPVNISQPTPSCKKNNTVNIRTRLIGANPEKSDLVNIRGPD